MWTEWFLLNYEYAASMLLAAIGGLILCTDDFQFLQLNSYYNSRYFRWFKGNTEKYICRIAWIAVIILSCAFKIGGRRWIAVPVCAIFVAWAFFSVRAHQKKAIKPLVFTPRVIRMYVTDAVLLFALAYLTARFADKANWIVLPFVLLAVETPLTVVAANFINRPVEACVRRGFINDAQKILKRQPDLVVIGITGSFGKTSTKFILARILQEKYNVVYTPASFNTPMGVVRTIREKMKNTDQMFICEMGAKNIGDIKEICDIVHPSVGIITSVGNQHLETFKTVDNVAKTKFELADAVKSRGGKIYVNTDCEAARGKASQYNCVTYGTANSQATVHDISCGRFGAQFCVKYKDEDIELSTKLLGTHNVLNIAGAVAAAYDLGVSVRDIKYAVQRVKPIEHRLELKPFINGSVLIDDAYNANPSGSIEAVNVLASFDGMKRIIVTPGLVELGDDEYECNRRLGAYAAEKLDIIILVGEERSVPLADGVNSVEGFNKDNMHVASSFKDAMALLQTMTDSNTVVLFENDLPDNYAK